MFPARHWLDRLEKVAVFLSKMARLCVAAIPIPFAARDEYYSKNIVNALSLCAAAKTTIVMIRVD
jgi:hypothetical protein